MYNGRTKPKIREINGVNKHSIWELTAQDTFETY